MLTYNPDKRITAKQALSHPWIQKNTYNQPLKSSVLKNMREFESRSRLRHAIMTFMTQRLLSTKELQKLRQTFTSLDSDGDGILTKEELVQGYKQVFPSEGEDEILQLVDSLLEQADINSEGVIKFTDFLVAASDKSHLLDNKQIRKVFKLFDKDNSGYIEWEELKEVIVCGNITDDDFQGMVDQFDQNGDGKVSQLLLLLFPFLSCSTNYLRFRSHMRSLK